MFIKENITTEEELYTEAKNLYDLGLLKQAKEKFIKLTLNSSQTWQYWFALGSIYQAEKNYAQAIFTYNLALLINKQNENIYFHLAECHLSLGNKKDAIKLLSLALKYCKDKDLLEKILIIKKQNKNDRTN